MVRNRRKQMGEGMRGQGEGGEEMDVGNVGNDTMIR